MATKKTTKKVPAKKTSSKKKSTVKKVSTNKAVNKVAKKVIAKKIAPKKPAAKVKSSKKTTKKVAKKVVAKKRAPKKPAAKVKSAKKTTKKVAKKVVAKKMAPKKPAAKANLAKKTTKKAVKKVAERKPVAKNKVSTKKRLTIAKEEYLSTVIENEKISKSIARPKKDNAASVVFSLEDVEALVAKQKDDAPQETIKPKAKKVVKKKVPAIKIKPTKKQSHAPASVLDILGFNPAKKDNPRSLADKEVPAKWKKYYKLLIELRKHVKEELALHTSETLKQSAKDDSGDLSGYGSHQADAGTDSFDRDFALGLLSSEQDALNEIEESIIRIKNGSYGICEETGKPINKERLTAVPFARYSLEGQKEFEKNNRKRRERAVTGLFDDTSDSPNMSNSSEDE